MKINFTSQIVRGVENTGMQTLGYFALAHFHLSQILFLPRNVEKQSINSFRKGKTLRFR